MKSNWSIQPRAPPGYADFHFTGGLLVNPEFQDSQDTRVLLGQHRAWSDGSVEWIGSGYIDSAPADAGTSAAYELTLPGIDVYYYF